MSHKYYKKEILCRLVFVGYLLNLLTTFLLIILGFSQGNFTIFITGCLAGLTSITIHYYGMTSLNFKGLWRSFPSGAIEDQIPENVKKDFFAIISSFITETNWQQRQISRTKLSALLKKEPMLMDIYPKEINILKPHSVSQSAKKEN